MSVVDRLLALPRPILVALDVDGTLAPIVRNPEESAIPAPTLRSLAELVLKPDARVALITGRDLASLSRMETLSGIWRGVEHGGVVIAPGEEPGPRALDDDQRHALEDFRRWAEEHAKDAFVELKPGAVAVHVRVLAETKPERAEALLDQAEEAASSLGLHVRLGRCLREAEAAKHDKGEALREIFARSGAESVFFAGDDITDLPAIEFAVNQGIGAFVVSKERPDPPVEGVLRVEGVGTMATILSELVARLS
ncbi:MAG: trehalose-phosphatase [Myxococcota bacterium]